MSQILDFKETGTVFHPVGLLAYTWTNCPWQPQRGEAEIWLRLPAVNVRDAGIESGSC